MAKDSREIIQLHCTVCDKSVYTTTKRVKPRSGEEIKRLEISKYCKYCRKRTMHKESK
jgi:large subunit ribosomal protein L33